MCFRSIKNEKQPPNCYHSLQRSRLRGWTVHTVGILIGKYHFSLKRKTNRCSHLTFFSQEEPLCPCSATQHPAREALLPRSQLQPSICLPSWLPTPTSGLPACVKPMGHIAVSSSSLRPPVSDSLGLGALFCLLGS